MATKDDSEESDFSPPSGRQSAAFKLPSPIANAVIPPPPQKKLSANLEKLQRLRSSSRMGEARVPVEPFKVRISHVISPKVFYIQRSDRLEELEEFREKIQTTATSANALPDPSDGMLVLAKFTDDDAWYRARVKTIDNRKTVFYIDYGNTEVLESNDCKVLSDHLKDVEPFCEVCSLCDAEPANGEEWSEEACNHFNILVCCDYDLVATDVIRSSGLLSVRLEVPPCSAIRNDSPVCISNALRFLGFARGDARVDEGLVNRELEIARFTTQKYYFVHISHAINVNSFYVQFLHEGMSPDGSPTPFQKDLQDFYTKVTEANDLSILTVGPLRVGMLVVAPYSDDGCFYRARITSLQGCNAEVFYLDYGNSGKVHVLNVHKLVDRFLELPQMAVRCTLELEGNINHPRVVNAFGEFMAKNDIVKMKVVEVLSDQLVVVRLFSADEGNQPSIGEHFIKLLKSVISPCPVGSQSSRKEVGAVSPKLVSPLPQLRSTPKPESGPDAHLKLAKERGFEPVVVTHYVSPAEIYIRPTERDVTWTVFNTDFDMTMKRKSPENRVKVLKEGEHYAYLKRSSWYRVRILKIEDNLCDIKYIDIGKTERVSVYDEFAKLPPETNKTKSYCLRIQLHNLIPAGDKGWSITATEKLGQNVKGIKLFIKQMDDVICAENDEEKSVPITMLAYERRASHPLKPMEDVWTDLGKKLVKDGLALKITRSASPPSNIMGINKLFTENGSEIAEVGSDAA